MWTLFFSIRRRKGVSSLVEEEETPFRGRLYVGIGPAEFPPKVIGDFELLWIGFRAVKVDDDIAETPSGARFETLELYFNPAEDVESESGLSSLSDGVEVDVRFVFQIGEVR